MSFSSVIKEELCRVEVQKKCCAAAELNAAFTMNSAAAFTMNSAAAFPMDSAASAVPNGAAAPRADRLVTENAAFARRAFNMLRWLRAASPEIVVGKNRRLKKNASYEVRVGAAPAQGGDSGGAPGGGAPGCGGANAEIFSGLGALRGLTGSNCCKKAAIRGAFLAGGSIADPEKLYHLEICFKRLDLALFFSELMSHFCLNPRITERTDYCVVYVKDSEKIVDFLNVTGAHRALMSFENTRIMKDMRNNVNRAVNCETANLEKTVNASLRQLANILYIRDTVGFDALPQSLRDIAKTRAENREISLRELGQALVPPLGKSGVNHRLRKLDSIADEIRASSGHPKPV